MGFLSFIKNVGNKVLGGVHSAGKFIGQHVAPVVSGIASLVSKASPYVAGLAGALGQPEIAGLATGAGRIADTVKGYSDKFSQSKLGGGQGG
jgi:hypothetical protein